MSFQIIQEMPPKDEAVFRAGLEDESYVQKHFPPGQMTFDYDIMAYPFRAAIKDALVANGFIPAEAELENIHEYLSPEDMKVDGNQINRVTAFFYDTPPAFLDAYHAFMRNYVAKEIIHEPFYFQRTPTIRFHFPNADGMDAVERFHIDSILGHPPQEVNLWVPMTDAGRHQSFVLGNLDGSLEILQRCEFDLRKFAESLYGDDGFQSDCRKLCSPVETKYGECLLFDSRCLHSAVVNESGTTRVSIDVRVLRVSDFEAIPFEYKGTGRTKVSFTPGHYYAAEPITPSV